MWDECVHILSFYCLLKSEDKIVSADFLRKLMQGSIMCSEISKASPERAGVFAVGIDHHFCKARTTF